MSSVNIQLLAVCAIFIRYNQCHVNVMYTGYT